MHYLLAETQTPQEINWTLEILKMVVPAAITLITVLLGLWIWHKKQKGLQKYNCLSYLNQKWLDALMEAFSLLAYMTKGENPKTILVWERDDKNNVYYLRPPQAREFIVKLSEIFYKNGSGLFLEQEVKRLFYKYRSNLYGVLLKHKDDGDERIRLENEHLVKDMEKIYNELNSLLRSELEKIGKQ